MSLEYIIFSNLCLLAFVYFVYNINDISYKLFMALLAYQACAKNSKDKLQKSILISLANRLFITCFYIKCIAFLIIIIFLLWL